MTSASAPGKVILFGEHAVVYGRPALAIPVTQVAARVEVFDTNRPGIWIEAPDVQLSAELSSLAADQPVAATIRKVLAYAKATNHPSLKIKINSTIPIAAGLGSGAAISVALIRALAGYLHHTPSDDEVSRMTFEIEMLYHGTPSGIDNTVITFAQPIYFMKGLPVELFHAGGPFTIVIGDSGIPAPTKESVGDVRRLWSGDPSRYETLFDKIGAIARSARAAIESAHWLELGDLMNQNHSYLQELTVSSPLLDQLVQTARDSGAWGAKLSGGGRGGNMIALVPAEKIASVSEALSSAGARQVLTTTIEP